METLQPQCGGLVSFYVEALGRASVRSRHIFYVLERTRRTEIKMMHRRTFGDWPKRVAGLLNNARQETKVRNYWFVSLVVSCSA